MKKSLVIACVAIILLSLAVALCAFLGAFGQKSIPGLTIVKAPEQTESQRPDCFPDPTENYVPLPDGTNLAEGKTVTSGEHTDVYVSTNVNDGSTDTYWESKGFPAEMTIDLGESYKISTVAVLLNPSALWEARTQEIAVAVSSDGETFQEVSPATRHTFDPNTGNRIRIDLDSTAARYVKVTFTMNSSSRTGGAQAAEIQVYE